MQGAAPENQCFPRMVVISVTHDGLCVACDDYATLNENVLPAPGLLSTQIRPPCASTMHFEI
jgi:hypothetical protein